MSLIRTIVSFEELDYYALKQEAAKRKKSFSAVVREIVEPVIENQTRSPEEVERIMSQTRRHAKAMSKYLKGVDGVKIIREMRDNAKW